MPHKLIQGDRLPPLKLNLIDGRTITLPDELPGRYLALLFYRGHWCPYCIRHLAGYQAKLSELQELGVTVIAASVDPLDITQKLVTEKGFTFPFAYGVKEKDVTSLDAWWTMDTHGLYIQPTELLVLRGGGIFGSLYASGPVGRMDVEDVLISIRGRERRWLEQERQAPVAGSQRS